MSAIRFLKSSPRFIFFTGKGGVGKTSLACATAVRLATEQKPVLLVSTDPASNVGQVFGEKIGNQVTKIAAVPGLEALEIDPQAAAQSYRDRIVGPVRSLLPDTVIQEIEEQLSGACTIEIAAFDEFTKLLIDPGLTKTYEHIIFDTAPTGHTIRLLQLPGTWSGFLQRGKGDASCLGPLSGLEKQRIQYEEAVLALADPARSRLVLVARAQQTTLREVARTQRELAAIGLTEQYLVINGVLPDKEASQDDLSAAIHHREQRALSSMPESLKALPQDLISLKPFNLVGLDALKRLLLPEEDSTYPDSQGIPVPPQALTLSALVEEILPDQHGLVMLMGKGGVGKTTMAAAIAVEIASRGLPVHLTTTDPAAHLSETLAGSLPYLTVSRIDPDKETERYRQYVLETRGARLDEEGRALLEEDLRSPCTEEIAVFQAFSRIIREAGRTFVVMDTAPTGHTLLLLDATGAYHREVSRHKGQSEVHVTTPMMQLRDPRQTKVIIVTLAETTPVLEADSLQSDLRRAGIEPWAWIINNSLVETNSKSGLLRQRAITEVREINQVSSHHARRFALVALQQEEPIGIDPLRRLADATGALVQHNGSGSGS